MDPVTFSATSLVLLLVLFWVGRHCVKKYWLLGLNLLLKFLVATASKMLVLFGCHRKVEVTVEESP